MDFIKKIFRSTEKEEMVEIRDDDVFLVSYPKSGNTWVRFLLCNYLSDDRIDFNNSNILIPDIHYNPKQINEISSSPRFIKSHFPYREEYKNAIYIIRDGRDVAVSYYFFQILANEVHESVAFEKYLYDIFLTGKSLFGDWGEHVESWQNNSKNKILFVKYEELFIDTPKVLKEILNFCKIEIENEKFNKAIENSTFDSMKEREKSNHKLFFEERKIKNTGYGFMRKGKIGDWKNHFNDKMLQAFDARYNSLMTKLGYY